MQNGDTTEGYRFCPAAAAAAAAAAAVVVVVVVVLVLVVVLVVDIVLDEKAFLARSLLIGQITCGGISKPARRWVTPLVVGGSSVIPVSKSRIRYSDQSVNCAPHILFSLFWMLAE